MSVLIVCRAPLNSGRLPTGGPEVYRSRRGCLSPSVSPGGRQGGGVEDKEVAGRCGGKVSLPWMLDSSFMFVQFDF